jgi:hypothetical protein
MKLKIQQVKIPLKHFERCIDDNIGSIGILTELLAENVPKSIRQLLTRAIELIQDENSYLTMYDPLRYKDRAKNTKQLIGVKYQISLF